MPTLLILSRHYSADTTTSGFSQKSMPSSTSSAAESSSKRALTWYILSAQKNKICLWTAVDHFKKGILGWVLGDRSAKTFCPLWEVVATWQCYFYVTDGWKVYPTFIEESDQIVSKTYMTRVKGENTWLRHCSTASQEPVLL